MHPLQYFSFPTPLLVSFRTNGRLIVAIVHAGTLPILWGQVIAAAEARVFSRH